MKDNKKVLIISHAFCIKSATFTDKKNRFRTDLTKLSILVAFHGKFPITLLNISKSELCIFYVFHNLQVNVRKKTHAARKLFSFHIISMAKNNRIVFSFITNENESSFLLEYIPLMGNVWVCRVTWTICVQVSFHLSRFGFLGLAGDRYLAIVHPLKYRDLCKTKNGRTAVLIFLMITVIINIPYPMYINDAETGKKRTSLSLPFLENVVAMS